jgi:predicted RNA-binding protein with TRAM domain
VGLKHATCVSTPGRCDTTGQSGTAPIEEAETHHLEIEELGDEGDSIAYMEAFVIFVPETEPTDAVDIEIDSV